MSPDVLLECPRTSFRDVLRVNVTERVWIFPPLLRKRRGCFKLRQENFLQNLCRASYGRDVYAHSINDCKENLKEVRGRGFEIEGTFADQCNNSCQLTKWSRGAQGNKTLWNFPWMGASMMSRILQ